MSLRPQEPPVTETMYSDVFVEALARGVYGINTGSVEGFDTSMYRGRWIKNTRTLLIKAEQEVRDARSNSL